MPGLPAPVCARSKESQLQSQWTRFVSLKNQEAGMLVAAAERYNQFFGLPLDYQNRCSEPRTLPPMNVLWP